MDREALIGVIGAVVVVAALVGVLSYGVTQSPDPETLHDIQWSQREAALPPIESRLDISDGERPHSIPVEQRNLTTVTVRLTWSDPNGANDRFRLRVEPPEPLSAEDAVEGATGGLEIHHVLDDAPDAGSILAPDAATARARADDEYGRDRGRGAWMVYVELLSAPPALEPLPGVSPTPDGAEDYSLSVQYGYYMAQI